MDAALGMLRAMRSAGCPGRMRDTPPFCTLLTYFVPFARITRPSLPARSRLRRVNRPVVRHFDVVEPRGPGDARFAGGSAGLQVEPADDRHGRIVRAGPAVSIRDVEHAPGDV